MRAARKIWNLAWRLGLCLLLLLWIFHSIFVNEARLAARHQGQPFNQLPRIEQWQKGWTQGPPQLWESLTSVSAWVFFKSWLLVGVILALGVMRWRMVLRVHGIILPFTRATEISLVAHFFNSFFLGSTGGDLMKAYYAARETHHKKTEAVVTVFVDRLVGLWAMLLFAGGMMLPNRALLSSDPLLRLPVIVVLCMLLGSSALMVLAFYGGVSRRWSGARDWLRRLPKGEWLEQLLEACREFGREKFFVSRALAISVALNVATVFQFTVLASGLGLRIPLVMMFVIVPTIICIASLPITPSGLGVRENLFVIMLAAAPIGV
ncbi:MAG TPA: lysylphosphatidylglycerol synthase transmembrane domain-containing protein, partial [Verrucomicrobiae bacterium]|nr:lysylphosphatidylglycerol synthase transmembrane domain-containing protein [Verrucomicrobiae bacterium]